MNNCVQYFSLRKYNINNSVKGPKNNANFDLTIKMLRKKLTETGNVFKLYRIEMLCRWHKKRPNHRIKDDRMEKPLKGRQFMHNLL